MRRVIGCVVCGLCVVAMGGCFTPPGAVLGLGMDLAKAGAGSYEQGRMSTLWRADVNRLADSAVAALNTLDLAIRSDTSANGSRYIRASDFKGRVVSITVSPSTPNLSLAVVRVGFADDPVYVTLVVDELGRQMDETPAKR
ncbi:MAG: DUF3568 family protein [Phycisphaerales bacterium]|nr:MAG: DUF3568 family protein [Phycisphaerales bacterium]